MFKVTSPGKMNERLPEHLTAAISTACWRCMSPRQAETATGRSEIGAELAELLELPRTMVSENNFYIQHGDLTLLRADYELRDNEGAAIMSGSSAVRQQIDGAWLYVIDHAAGASLPRILRRAS